jgi:membrane-associated phospholipid phosphatase
MKAVKKFLLRLSATDFIVVVFSSLLIIINFIFFNRIVTPYWNILTNLTVISFVFYSTITLTKKSSFVLKQMHTWYLVPLIFIFYKELYLMVDPIRGKIYDGILIIIDRFIFRTDPTIELFKIANPYLTELLQIVYGTFFFLPVILGIDLIRQKKTGEYNQTVFFIVYGFFLSYIGYFLFPAIGPRFTLHDFEMNNIEMPGIFITNILREIVNSGESIPPGTLFPALSVQRDAFPSGHTQMTLLVMILSIRFKSRFRWFFLLNGTLLIFATVYLRYHYVADLIGGFFFMLFTLWSGKYFYKWWTSIVKSENFTR